MVGANFLAVRASDVGSSIFGGRPPPGRDGRVHFILRTYDVAELVAYLKARGVQFEATLYEAPPFAGKHQGARP
jgi:hypothetical protein